ncbi:hypothetical protein GDO78_002148 [Eleutherodactylus coqui]|uniref:Uncharacterized protein n=1 Tax=Eleutherodactylus coqui TaxID=57060 RepID=A0A8J6FVT6_ELECQ|nr:hypothetical protein GDO78_002148 [Eleutherodactylus coqui]
MEGKKKQSTILLYTFCVLLSTRRTSFNLPGAGCLISQSWCVLPPKEVLAYENGLSYNTSQHHTHIEANLFL